MTYQSRFACASPSSPGTVGAVAEVLELDLDGYEGPLHTLLELARRQRVDLREISISDLADQYLAFVRDLVRVRLEPAADHLVMAAWLAELKSRLLLPQLVPDAESSPQETTAELARRLARLEAIRRAAAALTARPRLGRDVFVRGAPSVLAGPSERKAAGDLYRLIKAYPRTGERSASRDYTPVRRVEALGLADARAHLEVLTASLRDWTDLVAATPHRLVRCGPSLASCVASTLAATLELAREGRLCVRQDTASAPVWLRASHRDDGAESPAAVT